MADNRSVVITLKLDGGGKEDDVSNQVDTKKTSSKSDKDSMAKAAYTHLALQCLEVAVSEAVSWADYYHNNSLTLNDDYIGQRNKRVALQQINTAISSVSTIGSFAIAGSAAGPVGAAIGAALGLGVSIAKIARSNIQGQQQQDIQLRQMNQQLNFTRARAGWSLRAASIGEDL